MSSEVQNTDLSALRIKNRPSQAEGGSGARTRLWIYVGVAGAVVALGLILIYTGGASSQEQVDIVTVSMTSPGQAGTVLTASGYVVADIKAAVASKGTGRLEYLGVEEGDYVKKGRIIGRIESSDVEANLGQAKANVAVARATVDQAKAELDDATSNFERQKSLMEQKLISQSEFDAANARYRRAVALLSSAKASVQSAEAGVRSAEVGVENTLIRAPFDGVVLTKSANVGEVMTPFGAAAGSRGALVTMADMSSLEVEADVSESNIEKVTPKQPCEITLDAIPEKRYRGFVHKIIPTADRAKATVLVKVRFENKDERVLPEMSAKVLFLNKEKVTPASSVPKISIPASAITTRNGKKVVFVVQNDVATETPIVLGEMFGSVVEVKRGVAVGEKVILRPSESLATGTQVTTKK